MELEIISPERIIFQGEISTISLPGTLGQFSVHSNHAPIISSLKEGEITYTTDEGPVVIRVDSGFAEVRDNKISVCIEKILD